MDRIQRPRTLGPAERALRILFIAKHANWCGGLHPEDGNHALYHREIRLALEAIGVNLQLADDYGVLIDPQGVDFVFPLLNRGGFLNSEMLLPLLCERRGVAYLGASPILRGLSDDKHLAKRVAVARGVPTAPWAVFRRGAPLERQVCPAGSHFVIKPNASSASWGVSDAWDWDGVSAAVMRLHREGHDAIVEPFVEGHDIEVSVITLDGRPFLLPTQIVEQDDPTRLRTYQEKRSLVTDQGYAIRPFADVARLDRVEDFAREMLKEFVPFDYGRFEFRLDVRTGEVRFLEVNLNCNLSSAKTIALAAGQIGWSHAELVETILAESLRRQNIARGRIDVAA
ncbi:MAG TPA: hypothetical protein VF474_05890 [Phenylobacterium sp.]